MKRGTFRKPTIKEVREKQAKKRALRSHKMPVAKSKPKKALKTQAWLKKELDRVFSIYIRRKYADENGICTCITCGKKIPWQQIQAGHFVSRQYLATRWDENNVRPQCVGDNIFGNGKPLDFEDALKKELGQQYVEEMKQKRREVIKLDSAWYNERIQFYKNAISTFTN